MQKVGQRHGSEILSPADRLATTQIIGVGYVVNPRLRFGMMGIFSEAFTGLPAGAIRTFEHVIIGGSPLIGDRSGGTHRANVGAIVLSGASIPLKRGPSTERRHARFAVFVRRTIVSVGVASAPTSMIGRAPRAGRLAEWPCSATLRTP